MQHYLILYDNGWGQGTGVDTSLSCVEEGVSEIRNTITNIPDTNVDKITQNLLLGKKKNHK